MNDRKIKYIDLNGLKYFATELKEYLERHIMEYSIYEELLERIKNLENDIENYTFYEVVESYDKLLELNNPQKNIIYLVPDGNNFLEYVWTDNKYEQLGSFTPELKLDDYLKVEDSPFEKGAGKNSVVLKGANNTASGYVSVAIGENTKAKGNLSFTQGEGTNAINIAEVAFGKYNISRGDTLFSIGIGNSNVNKNAIEVFKNGEVYIKDIGNYNGISEHNIKSIQTVIGELQTRIQQLEDIVQQITEQE